MTLFQAQAYADKGGFVIVDGDTRELWAYDGNPDGEMVELAEFDDA